MTRIGTGNGKNDLGELEAAAKKADFSTSLRFGRNDVC